MTESNDNIGFKEIEDGCPVYFTKDKKDRLYCEDHRIMLVDDIYKINGVNKNIILGNYEAKFYEFFEINEGKAFTINALVDRFFGDDAVYQNTKKVERDLMKMVERGKLKGVYVKGHYYFHF
jgi:hypothetical protein